MSSLPTMLFVRTYHGMLGGHLKVFDYLRHVAESGTFEPVLWLTHESTEMPPRALLPDDVSIVREPSAASAYFVAGMNWNLLEREGIDLGNAPVVNLVQGLRHAIEGDPRRAFLKRAALRICVSEAVRTAIDATGEANGPLVTIPNAIDQSHVAAYGNSPKPTRIFVAGAKDPPLAKAVSDRLLASGVDVDMLCDLVSRDEFLRRMGSSSIAIVLPLPVEGFYLPALEAMAMGVTVIIPPCEGASGFCIDDETCVVASRDADALVAAAMRLLNQPKRCEVLRERARATAARFTLANERNAFQAALRDYVSSAPRLS